jgi:GPH family glycoside/pentoside/hexuronide:cation symporter
MKAKLSFKTKLFYGIGDMAAASVNGAIGFLFTPFLLNVAGISPFLLGWIFLIKQPWDAINDPLMGQLSDRTESRFGRRKIWLIVATVPLALLFVMSWLVPDVSIWGKFAYYLVMVVLLDTFYTMHNVPYAALTAEMTDDYQERTQVNMFRFGFSLIGSLISTIVFVLITSGAADQQAAFFKAAWIIMLVIIVTGFSPAFFTPENNPKIDRSVKRDSLIQSFKSVMQVRPFRHVILLLLFSGTAVAVVRGHIILYMQYWIRPTGANSILILVVLLQLSAVIFLVFYGWLSKYLDKKVIYYIGGATWVVVFSLGFFVQQGQELVVNLLAILGGSGVAVALLIPYSMLPDVVDYDELQNGERREGVFYGFFLFIDKVVRGAGLAFLSFTLGWAGYQEAFDGVAAVTQPDAVLLTLRIFVSLIPAGLVLISFIFASRYEITKEVHQDILHQLGKQVES